MRRLINLNQGWNFVAIDESYDLAINEEGEAVDLPHTWNNHDGQDGGNNYCRSAFWYVKHIDRPEISEGERIYLEIPAANSSADVYVNGENLCHHDGGYSLFRVDITDHLNDTDNIIAICCDNKPNETVYPQTADFTFYGGLYRGVNILIVPEVHFDVEYYGNPGIKCDSTIDPRKKEAKLIVSSFGPLPDDVRISVLDNGEEIASGKANEEIIIENVHLWHGLKDPYLYEIVASAYVNDEIVDQVRTKYGFRYFKVDSRRGFFLNGEDYPLRGVARHQDYLDLGNALTEKEMQQDIDIMKEVGATTVRLAHYQHNQRFYEMCDEAGFVVWSEIPYISRHMEGANDNAISQMRELIVQSYNNPSIICRGLSNEITMKPSNGKIRFHKKLRKVVEEMDPSRFHCMANFAMVFCVNPIAHISDATSMNFYHGWYTPWTWLNGVRLSVYHFFFPSRPLGFSEYGAEGMPNLHSEHPKRGDNTEEYQFICHNKIYKALDKRHYLWATHLWNMFDFAADGRNVGGDPGKNHKGLVTFDRKIKKDSFYLYKAYWSDQPFVHLSGHRFEDRTEEYTNVYVMTNIPSFKVYQDGNEIYSVEDGKEKMYKIKVHLTGESDIVVKSGKHMDQIHIRHVDEPNPSYKLQVKSNNASWEK